MSLSLGDRPSLEVSPVPVPQSLCPALVCPRGPLHWPLVAIQGHKSLLEGCPHRWIGPLWVCGSGWLTPQSELGACGQDSL